ncbi:MAG: hypothetical protein ACK5MV_00020 [Aminipila sp.]
MSYGINNFIQDHADVIEKVMQAEVDTNSSQEGVQKPGADVAYDIIGEIIKTGDGYEKYGISQSDITDKLKDDYNKVVAG